MNARVLELRGVKLTPKLAYQSDTPLDADTLALLSTHRDELLRNLIAPDSLPQLPWQLARLIKAASSGLLEDISINGVPNVDTYTLAWAASYLTGDQDEALNRLWQVYREWSRARGDSLGQGP